VNPNPEPNPTLSLTLFLTMYVSCLPSLTRPPSLTPFPSLTHSPSQASGGLSTDAGRIVGEVLLLNHVHFAEHLLNPLHFAELFALQ